MKTFAYIYRKKMHSQKRFGFLSSSVMRRKKVTLRKLAEFARTQRNAMQQTRRVQMGGQLAIGRSKRLALAGVSGFCRNESGGRGVSYDPLPVQSKEGDWGLIPSLLSAHPVAQIAVKIPCPPPSALCFPFRVKNRGEGTIEGGESFGKSIKFSFGGFAAKKKHLLRGYNRVRYSAWA